MRLAMILLVLTGLTCPVVTSADAPRSQGLTLAAIQVVGATHTKEADAAYLSGLQVGRPIAVADLQGAAQRMVETGLFSKLQYRYVTAAGKMTVTFEVIEAPRDIPVVFDNFVSFADDELAAAVRQDVPGFDGKVPRDEAVPAHVSRSLERLLKTRGVAGQIGFRPQGDTQGNLLGFIFRIENPAPKLCSVSFVGASAEPQQALTAASSAVTGTEYSRFSTEAMLKGTYLGIYRRLGYWNVDLGQPSAAVDAACGGVAVSIQVTEGAKYRWEKAVWTGNAALSSATLDGILGFKRDDLADGARLESALIDVAKAYRKQGYLRVATKPTRQLDDTTKRVGFSIAVDEGPQYRMGTLTIMGLPPKDVEALQKRWKLASGQVFDDTYPSDFVSKEASRYRRQGTAGPALELREGTGHTVNVTITFK